MKENNELAKMEILKGIHQAAANAWDGSEDKRYLNDPKVTGLKRSDSPWDDKDAKRLFDSFKVKINDNLLTVVYNSQISNSDYKQSNKVKDEVERIFRDIIKYLKSEYKELTKNTLKLKEVGKVSVFLQHISSYRNTLVATKQFKIEGIESLHDE